MKVVDMHCDTIAEIYERRKQGESISLRENDLHLDLMRMKAGDYLLQNFGLFTHLGREKRPFEYAMALLDTFYTEIEANSDLIGVVKSYEDIEENRRLGRLSAMVTLEEGGVCQGSLAFLRNFYRLGVRMMTITWNFPNELGYPNGFDSALGETEPGSGLTKRGVEFVEEMERMGMIIDVSHLNDAGFWDVVKQTKKPFVASHSNCRALVTNCSRDLTDEMIRAIGERGGVAGINYCTDFLRDSREWGAEERKCSRIQDMVRHMKHMKQVGGIGCIGLGSDFDGIGGELELCGADRLPCLAVEMEKQGFTQSEIEAVFYKNVVRVYKEIL